ncbi:hypothetical protein AAKU64_001307 [Undibacterium sp. GrIS 1.8]
MDSLAYLVKIMGSILIPPAISEAKHLQKVTLASELSKTVFHHPLNKERSHAHAQKIGFADQTLPAMQSPVRLAKKMGKGMG